MILSYLCFRNIRAEETEAITDYLDGMFDCEVRGMYPEALTHNFMSFSASTRSVKQCIAFNENKPGCGHVALPKECTNANLDERLDNECHIKVEAAHQCYMGKNTTQCDDPELKPYINRLNCYVSVEDSDNCLRNVENQCKRQRLSVTKVHRLSMQSVEAIIQKIPDIYIIYYVRDPRGIFVSRTLQSPNLPIEALCDQMEKDYHIYKKLKLKYPKSIHMIRYEDLATDQEDTLQDLFSFIEEPITERTRNYLASITNATKDNSVQGVQREDSVKTSTAWRDKISMDAYETSKKKCGILKLLGYDI